MALKPMTPEQLFDSLLTATAAHKAGGGDDDDRKRDAWLGQFVFAFANDEGEEATSFQGTIPQALMMMNGELMEEAVGGKPGQLPGRPARAGPRQRRAARRVHGQQPLPGRPEPLPDRQGAAAGRASSSSSNPDTIWRPRRTCSGPCSTPTNSS